jgi:hypothetical protein
MNSWLPGHDSLLTSTFKRLPRAPGQRGRPAPGNQGPVPIVLDHLNLNAFRKPSTPCGSRNLSRHVTAAPGSAPACASASELIGYPAILRSYLLRSASAAARSAVHCMLIEFRIQSCPKLSEE